MIACFDIDGTLTAWPEVVVPLIKSLRKGGCRVVLLTGSIIDDPDPPLGPHVEARQKQVSQFQVEYDEIVVCPGPNTDVIAVKKAAYLAANNVSLFLDDDEKYCREARKYSPKTLTLQIPRK